MDEINIGEMAAPAAASLDEDGMCELFRKLLNFSNDDLEMSEEYSALTRSFMVDERRCLNLNGVLGSYPEADRTRALTFVFRLADRASVQSLLLEGNGIDDACLRSSLQDFMPENSNHHSTKLPKDSKRTHFLQALQEVDLSDNHLRGEGMEALCAIRWAQLRKLVLRGTGMRAIGCKHIENAIQAGNLEALESLDLYGNQIRDLGICNLAASLEKKCPPKLREIVLGKNEFGDSGVRAIARAISAGALQQFENIDLSSHEESKQHEYSSSPTISESAMVYLAASLDLGKASNLKVLDFRGFPMGDSGVKKLAEAIRSGSLRSLEKLDFSDNSEFVLSTRMDRALSVLANALGAGHAPKLRDLRLKGPGYPPGWWHKRPKEKRALPFAREAGIELVRAIESGGLKMLEGLHLSGYWDEKDVTYAFVVQSLGKRHIANLRELRLSGINRWESNGENDEGDDGEEDDGENDVEIDGENHSQNVCVVQLAKVIASGSLTSLEKLELSSNHCQRATDHYEALNSLASSLADGNAVNLQELTLSGFQVGPDGIDGLTKAIESGNLNLLKQLDLLGISSKGNTSLVAKLAEVMASGALKSLEVLSVADICRFGINFKDKSLEALVAALSKEHVVKLRKLNLSSPNLEDKGILKFAQAIRSGNLTSLETLSISGIGGTVADAPLANLAAAIGSGQMPHMKRLLFKDGGLGREGAAALADAMGFGRLPSLQKLHLVDDPEVDTVCADSFRRALETGRVPHIKEVLVRNLSGESPERPSSPKPPGPRFWNLAESYLSRRRKGLRIEVTEDSSTSVTGQEATAWEDVGEKSETSTSSPTLMEGALGSMTLQSRGDLPAFVIPGLVDMECDDSPCDYGDSGSEDWDEDSEVDMSEDEKHEE